MLLPIAALLALAVSPPALLPPGKGKAIVQHKCASCHALKVVTSKKASKQEWSRLVNQMISRGADVDDEEIPTVIEYLSKNFGLSSSGSVALRNTSVPHLVNVNQATAKELTAKLGLSSGESAAIIAYRQQNGKFKSLEDLTRVPGVEASKIEMKKERIRF